MAKLDKYIIRIDNKYVVSFEGKCNLGKTSNNGWNQQYTEMGNVELSKSKSSATVIEGNINLKSAFNKLYDRIRYGDFSFNQLEILKVEE